jgi:hypothetical protein
MIQQRAVEVEQNDLRAGPRGSSSVARNPCSRSLTIRQGPGPRESSRGTRAKADNSAGFFAPATAMIYSAQNSRAMSSGSIRVIPRVALGTFTWLRRCGKRRFRAA